jgi:hypothetical protein
VSQKLTEWSKQYQVRMTPDVCGDPIVPGIALQIECCHIYDYGDGRLGLCLMLDHGRKWSTAKRKAIAAGFILQQDGDREGCLLFDPANTEQSLLALKLAGIRRRRKQNSLRQTVLREYLSRLLESAAFA